ncbi:glutamate dehydrogenase [Candidatus Dojkabacteria bacterium]|nr:glutamate dehydrogenase [Candidatus Dojkabacteria bacterium]
MKDPYMNAVAQLEKIAEILKLDDEMLSRLKVPERFIEVNFPVEMDDGSVKIFKGFRSQHNSARGPYKGGLRFSPEVSESEVKALSMWMSWKCSVANIPYGGGKGGVIVNTKELSEAEIERLSRAFIHSIHEVIGPDKDIPAPDMYTNPQIMAWMVDEYSKDVGENTPAVITGKPIDKGGSEGRTAATGQGGVYILEALAEKKRMKAEETKVAVQGIGNVGYYFAKLAAELGFKIVALSDSRGAVYSQNGLDVEAVKKHKSDTGSIGGFSGEGVEEISNEDLLKLEVDVLVPAAVENVITKGNADGIKADFIIELANGPVTPEADEILHKNGVLFVPDILANSGGVTVSYFEWVQNKKEEKWSEEEVLSKLKDQIVPAFNDTMDMMDELKSDMRTAAYAIAVRRIVDEMRQY